MQVKLTTLSFLLILIGLIACSDVDPFEINSVNFGDPVIGVPLVNTTFLISDFGENPNDNTTVIADDEGKLKVRYSGDVLKQDADFVFPSSPYFDYIEITDTVSEMLLPLEDFLIKKAKFRGTSVKFLFENVLNEEVKVNMKIPEFFEDGQVFSRDFIVGPNTTYESDFISLDGALVETETSTFFFNYTALRPNGQRIKMERAAMFVDFLHFNYGEGYFGRKEFNLSEDIIEVTVFDNWVSGGLSFEQPEVRFDVENNFGFPVRAAFNKMQLTTIEGDIFQLEGPPIEDGINFNYPMIDEVGELKSTIIAFDSSNSNIGQLFNQKAASVSYDVDAIANPDNDDSILGHFTDSSYFTVKVSVDLPLSFKANDLIMSDTFGIEGVDYEQLDSLAELHLKITNAFPVSMSLNMDFLDENNSVLFSLVEQDQWVTANASGDPTQTLEELDAQVQIISVSPEDVTKFSSVKHVAIKAKISTLDTFGDDFVWIYDHHGIDIALGAILN